MVGTSALFVPRSSKALRPMYEVTLWIFIGLMLPLIGVTENNVISTTHPRVPLESICEIIIQIGKVSHWTLS